MPAICAGEKLLFFIIDVLKLESKSSTFKTYYFRGSLQTSLKFPSLLLPTPLSTIWGWTAAGLIIGSLIAEVVLINIWDFSSWILLWTVAAIIVVVQFDRLLEPFRTRIPDMTVREFINGVRTLNFKELSKATGVSRREMELVINEIIVNKLGVDPIEVAPEKSLTDDLGLD